MSANRTVTIDELARTVAQFTRCDAAEALSFVRETFMLAAETLSEGESVDIRYLGTFAAVDGTLRFRPDSDLAAEINAPFAAFSAIEVTDPSLLEEPAEEPEPEPEPEPQPEPEPEPEAEEPAEETVSVEEEPAEEPAEPEAPEARPVMAQPAVTRPAPRSVISEWLMPLMLAALCLTVGFVTGRLTAPSKVVTVEITRPLPETGEPAGQPAATATPAMPDDPIQSGAAPDERAGTQSQPRVVTDTIRKGRFLTTMARQHYGQMEYWVYIYKENADRLGNPDHVDPGTVVVIPPAEKYGLVAGDPDKIAEAKRLAAEIYKNH